MFMSLELDLLHIVVRCWSHLVPWQAHVTIEQFDIPNVVTHVEQQMCLVHVLISGSFCNNSILFKNMTNWVLSMYGSLFGHPLQITLVVFWHMNNQMKLLQYRAEFSQQNLYIFWPKFWESFVFFLCKFY